VSAATESRPKPCFTETVTVTVTETKNVASFGAVTETENEFRSISKAAHGCDAQLAYGELFPEGLTSGRDISGSTHDYKSICVAVMTHATVVNTDRQTYSFRPDILLAQPAKLKNLNALSYLTQKNEKKTIDT